MTIRVSTSALYAAGVTQMNTLQAQMAKTQNQLSTNKRILTAADDPIASAQVLQITQSQSMNTQFGTNRTNANTSLSTVDQTLSDVKDQIQSIQTLIVTAGNASYTDSDRQDLATELEGRLTDLIGLANTTDGTGTYLFSGYQSTTQPYTQTATGAVYNGDQGQRVLQVGSSRKMAISEAGSAIFDAIPTGNGTFVTQAASGNTGGGIISPGSVTDASKVTGHNYSLAFSVTGDPAVTSYTVTDNSVDPPSNVLADQPYTAGSAISFDGISFDVSGTPADGDSFTVQPSQKQSVFTTITNLIQTLKTGATGDAGQAALTNGLNMASQNMSNALDNVLTVDASVGARLKEIDTLNSTGSAIDLNYSSTLSTLQDLDYTSAVSLYSQQQTTLQAAQLSFQSMTSLSLFNYLS
jgi:flagellar hook-associated protein 3 FlgL